MPTDDQTPPAPPAPPSSPKLPPHQDEAYLTKLRQENGHWRQQYQAQKDEAARLQGMVNSMSDYETMKGKATALEEQLRGDRLTARLSSELSALGVTDPKQQAIIVKATDLTVTWDDKHQPQGDFSALKNTVDTLGLAPAQPPADNDATTPGEGTQAKPGNGQGQQSPSPPRVPGATHHAPDSVDRAATYEDVLAAGHAILDRVRSEGA
jgi:hypothetical protein